MPKHKALEEAIFEGKEKEAAEIAQELITAGASFREINETVNNGMFRASESWTTGQYSSAEILISIDAFHAVRDLAMKFFTTTEVKPIGRIIIGTIAGNVHQIGKALVTALLESEGFEVIDLGTNVSRAIFTAKTAELRPDILVLACYTLNAQNELKGLLSEIDQSGIRPSLKIIIGGHSTSQDLATRIGADAWAENLLDAAEKAKKLIQAK